MSSRPRQSTGSGQYQCVATPTFHLQYKMLHLTCISSMLLIQSACLKVVMVVRASYKQELPGYLYVTSPQIPSIKCAILYTFMSMVWFVILYKSYKLHYIVTPYFLSCSEEGISCVYNVHVCIPISSTSL